MIKKYNKFLTLLLFTFAVVVFSSLVCFASDDRVSIKIDEMIEDKSGWTGPEELKIQKDSVTHTNVKKTDYYNVYTNKNFTFLNELVSFNINVFQDLERKFKSRYILLRAKESDTFPYKGNDSYLFVLSESQIELQRWISNGSEFLAVVHNPLNHGDNLITCGAINTPEGVQIVLFVNGELIISVLDRTPGVLRDQKGYISFYNSEVQKISAVGDADVAPLPIATDFKISGSGNLDEEIAATYNFLDLNGNKEKNTKITWYTSKQDFVKESLLTKTAVPSGGLLTKIDGAGEHSYTPKAEDVGKYIYAAIEPSSDSGTNTPYLSNAIYIDPVNIVLNENICMIEDEQMAYVFGNCLQIDPKDPYIVPERVGGVSYIPLRFATEALGGSIDWNGVLKRAELKMDGKSVTFPIGLGNMLINGEEKVIEAPTYILYGRTMVPVSSLKEFCAKHIYLSKNGIILIGNYENVLNFDNNKELHDTIYKTIRYASYAN